MGKKGNPSSDSIGEPKKRRRVGFSVIDAGVEATDCIKIYFVASKEEVGSSDLSCIDPVDLNSFFGEDGKIYGYHGLKITIWISSISFHAYADISFQSSSDGGKGITDLKSSLQSIFAETLVENKDDFLETFSTESHFIRNIVSNGEVLQQKVNDEGKSHVKGDFEKTTSDLMAVRMVVGKTNGAYLYSRLIPLVLLLIDGSNPIDVTDPDWELYLLIQKKKDEEKLVGFTAVYRFYRYPDSSRLRLSQILVLPPYQRKGYGSYLVEIVSNVAISEKAHDFTVEEPLDQFQRIRTCFDIRRLLAFEPIQKAKTSAVLKLKHGKLSKKAEVTRFLPPSSAIQIVQEKLKINKKQFLRCWEILIYLGLDPVEKYIEEYEGIILNHVKADVLGKETEPTGKRIIDVPSPHEPEMSFVVYKSGGSEETSKVQMDKNQPNQEEQLQQLVDERMNEIKLVAEKVSLKNI